MIPLCAHSMSQTGSQGRGRGVRDGYGLRLAGAGGGVLVELETPLTVVLDQGGPAAFGVDHGCPDVDQGHP